MTDYAYVRRMYDVAPVVGQHVRIQGNDVIGGTVAPESADHPRSVMVAIEGCMRAWPVDPLSLEYLSGVDG